MIPIKKLRLLLFSIIVFYGCTFSDDQLPEIQFIGKRASIGVRDGQVVTFHMLYKTRSNQVIADTRLMDGPISIICKDSLWQHSGLFYQTLLQMGEGDSAIFAIPAKNFYNNAGEPVPEILNQDDSLYFQVRIESVK